MKREILKKALLLLPLLGIMGGAYFPEPAEAAEPWPPRDNFYWLGQINKASDIINTDEKLLTKEEGRRFAAAIQKVLDDGNNFLLKLVDRILPRFMPDVPVRTC